MDQISIMKKFNKIRKNHSEGLNTNLRAFFNAFFHNESTGGYILIICTIIALTITNVPGLKYLNELWHIKAGITIGELNLNMDLLHWVNDVLMVAFFFLVTLDIKREMLVGKIATSKKAALPIVAAIGGMVFPMLIYSIFNQGTEFANGWGIPIGTDIAFAVAILSLLGDKCPVSLKVFIMTLAIADDFGSIIVIALFYHIYSISFVYLLLALGVFLILIMLNRLKVNLVWIYIILGIVLWYFIYNSGIHPAIAGVLLALTIPSHSSINELRFHVRMDYLLDRFKELTNEDGKILAHNDEQYIIQRMHDKTREITPIMNRFIHFLRPLSTFVIIPLFVLANAGVAFNSDIIVWPLPSIFWGIFLGLIIGKPLGIYIFSWLSVKSKLTSLPEGVTWKQILAIGFIGGIGFTMSLFITNVAFVDKNTVGLGETIILFTSFIAAVIGYIALYETSPKVIKKKLRKKENSNK